jgi:hypothetical protein
MYLLTNSEGKPYLKPSGFPAVYKTMEELDRAVTENMIIDWAVKEVTEEEAKRMIQVAYAAGR